MKLKTANLQKMLDFMHERQIVFLKRQAGEPYPWTKDPILNKFRLCNVYRQDDKETRWLTDNWSKPYANHPNLWFAICMFRQINWSPTLAEIGFPEEWNPRKTLKILQARKDRGDKIYTSAYLIPSRGEKSKIVYTVNRVLHPLWKSWKRQHMDKNLQDHGFPFNSLEEAHGFFVEHYGFGKFLAYEVVTDLRHTRYLCNAPDIYTWGNTGPGAKRGICYLLGVDVKTPIPPKDQLDYLVEVFHWLKIHRDCSLIPTLEVRDAEHQLCEIFKYFRAEERIAAGRIVGLERFHPPVQRLVV